MKSGKNMNALLIEIMVAVLFFALCATVILEIFGHAKNVSMKSENSSDAVIYMQDVSERMYAAEDMTEVLTADGFEEADGQWQLVCGEYTVNAVVTEEETEVGVIVSVTLRAETDGEVIAELPCVRYTGKEVK